MSNRLHNEEKRRRRAYRFLRHIEIGNECWTWMGTVHGNGYGAYQGRRIFGGGRSKFAHRHSYELFRGPIPPSLHVLHRCDTPRCVRPSHLFAGTQADNVADKVRKGRQAKGQDNPRSVLTVESVREARAMWHMGAQCFELAKMYGVHPSTMSSALVGLTWRHA